jgi:hypothetical protein
MSPAQVAENASLQPEGIDFAELHASIFPADVRVNDRIVARLRKRAADVGSYEDVRVWRLSPLGIEIIDPEHGVEFDRGDAVDLELVIAGQRTSFEGLVVDLVQRGPRGRLIGIRFSRRAELRGVDVDRRKSVRWLCSDEFLPTCVAPAPGRFDDFMYFQIRDISAEGLQLTCSLRNKFLIPGMRLRLTAVFPMGSVVVLSVEIVRVGVVAMAGDEKLSLGTVFRDISPIGKRIIGQYLIQFSDAETLDELRAAGFVPGSIAQGTTYSCVKSEEDYRAVLELRYVAHKEAGQLHGVDSPEDMGDMHDAETRILMGKRRGRVLATARLRYPRSDDRLVAEEFVALPHDFPRRDQIIEMTRVATHPDFRRSDLLAGLFRFACMTGVDVDRPWLVGYCLDKHVNFYKRLGFSFLEQKFEHEGWQARLNIMVVNFFDMLKGKGVHPGYWNEVWRDVVPIVTQEGVVQLDGMDRVRIAFYKALHPFLRLLMRLAG